MATPNAEIPPSQADRPRRQILVVDDDLSLLDALQRRGLEAIRRRLGVTAPQASTTTAAGAGSLERAGATAAPVATNGGVPLKSKELENHHLQGKLPQDHRRGGIGRRSGDCGHARALA